MRMLHSYPPPDAVAPPRIFDVRISTRARARTSVAPPGMQHPHPQHGAARRHVSNELWRRHANGSPSAPAWVHSRSRVPDTPLCGPPPHRRTALTARR